MKGFSSEFLTYGNLQFIVKFCFNLQKTPSQYFPAAGTRERKTPGLFQDDRGQGIRIPWNGILNAGVLRAGRENARKEEAVGKGDD